ncbi:MAG TPA: putative Ig domain-containing protein [Steroidobacteraceae bacterium]
MFPFIVAVAAPLLSGSPATSVMAAHYYTFQPGVAGGGTAVTFAITNKPSWARFDTGTGRLFGTPLPQTNVGTYSNILISVSNGATRSYLAPFSITVAALPNNPPRISGSPATAVAAGQAYSFRPAASDPNGLRMVFAIANKPAWANFDTATGALTGTPAVADTGIYPNISITVYDGYGKAVLSAFSVAVKGASQPTPPTGPRTTGSATLSWQPPTRKTDGSTLTNLAGYHISYGTTPGNLPITINVTNPGVTRYVVGGLDSATTWYFEMTAYDKNGMQSPPTPIASIVIP